MRDSVARWEATSATWAAVVRYWIVDFMLGGKGRGTFCAARLAKRFLWVLQLHFSALALVRTGDLVNALVAFNNIRAANATTSSTYTAADFVAGSPLNLTSGGFSQTNALLLEVLREKYLSLIGQIEEFSDVRRTANLMGVPKNVTSAPSLPQCFLYPQSEINTNPNVPSPIPSRFTKTPVN